MDIDVRDQVVLLLTVSIIKQGGIPQRSLTPSEFKRFSLWLDGEGPGFEKLLMSTDLSSCLTGWSDQAISPDRVRSLLARAGALGLALEKWQRAGLWIMTCFDKEYPQRFLSRLSYPPPVLFGCGKRQLLNMGGISVVGSRDATEADLAFTRQLGGEIALQGYSLISGGARGVDDTAMLGALDQEGTGVAILSDSLLRTAVASKFRRALMEKNLALISPFNPEVGFDVGNAMARNKYIYCLSDAAVVIACTKGKGGTWSGAVENLKNDWVPVWVKSSNDEKSGNELLLNQGARLFPEDGISFKDEIARITSEKKCSVKKDIPELTYAVFLDRLGVLSKKGPVSINQLLNEFNLTKKSLNLWLKQAVEEGCIEKFIKPIRYRLIIKEQELF